MRHGGLPEATATLHECIIHNFTLGQMLVCDLHGLGEWRLENLLQINGGKLLQALVLSVAEVDIRSFQAVPRTCSVVDISLALALVRIFSFCFAFSPPKVLFFEADLSCTVHQTHMNPSLLGRQKRLLRRVPPLKCARRPIVSNPPVPGVIFARKTHKMFPSPVSPMDIPPVPHAIARGDLPHRPSLEFLSRGHSASGKMHSPVYPSHPFRFWLGGFPENRLQKRNRGPF